MAGGEGSRLRPLTCDLPKPMVPVMNRPIMEHIIYLLKSHGITDIGVTLMYLPQKIRDYFGNGSYFGVNLRYYIEDEPLGTAGSVKNAEDFLNETFIVISGDSLTNIDISSAVKYHYSKKSKATLVLTRVDVPLEYGVVITDKNGAVSGFLEKPSWSEVFSDTVNTGIYILEPEVLKYFEKGKKFDFSQELFPMMLSRKGSLFGYVMSGYWCDIGDLRAYVQAHHDILKGKIHVEIDGTEIEKDVWVGSGSNIDPGAVIKGPCVIGKNCRVGSGTIIEDMSVLGNNNIIEDKVSLKRCVIWDNNSIEFGSEIRGSVICSKVHLKHYVSLFENAVIGDECVINDRAIIKPGVKIWPQKVVDTLAIVDRNLIWGSRHMKTIFGENGLAGIINVDISPEFATRLGAAYGSLFKKGSKVVVSSTTSNSARMFKHAFISGILSVGVEVFNLSSLLTPISRHAINFLSVEGGIHIKLSEDNQNRLCVDFMDFMGISISRSTERKIENAFIREDFKRCSGEEISRLNNITDFKDYYMRSVLNELNTQAIRSKAPRICLASPSDFVISVVVPMLSDIGCKVACFSSFKLDKVERIVEEINKSGADFGAFIDSNAERLVLIEKSGKVVKDDLFLLLTALIIFRTAPEIKVIVPVTAPSAVERLAEKYGGKVVRTKTSSQAVMEKMLSYNLFKNRDYMKQFQLNFDALAGLVKIIEFLCTYDMTLSDALAEIPVFHISKKSVFCPWDLKGKVMRTLITKKSNERVELLDGVKFINDGNWGLILPDADKPLFRILAEGKTPQDAEETCDKYIGRIRSIVDSSQEMT